MPGKCLGGLAGERGSDGAVLKVDTAGTFRNDEMLRRLHLPEGLCMMCIAAGEQVCVRAPVCTLNSCLDPVRVGNYYEL